jgi:sugar phosphate isomerase/epimerase
MLGSSQTSLSRRDVLKAAAVGALAAFELSGAPRAAVAAEPGHDPYAGLKMGMQSYSLRGYPVGAALKHTRTLGLHYWESFPAHIPLSTLPKNLAASKALLKDAGVTLLAYGVVDFDANETAARQKFDFGKAMGLLAFSANPRKDKQTFDLLDKLVAEYGIAIAIHNHGPGANYDKIDDVVKMVKDRHPKIGACVDTGHYLRSDENPVEAIDRLRERLYGVHLKDVRTLPGAKRRKQFTILGQGDLDLAGCLKLLKKLNYDGCLSLEYEENPDNPLSDIAVSLQAVRQAAAKLG